MTRTTPLLAFSLCVLASLFAAPAGRGEIVYQDDFDGPAGSLIEKRSPTPVNKTGNAYSVVGSPTQLLVDGSGNAVTNGEGGILHIELPGVVSGDVLTVTAKIRPASLTGNWMGVGFTDGTSDLVTCGAAWALLNGSGPANQGTVVVRSGLGDKGILYRSPAREPGWDDSAASTLVLVYTTTTGNLKVTLGADTLFDGQIAFDDSPATPAPISALSHVTIQWFAQNPLSDPEPGLVDSLQVEVDSASRAR